jgi:DNA-binding transcriptional regulator YiaG
MKEQWRPIDGWPAYEVSNLGRVRSVDRPVRHRCGGAAMRRGRILRQTSGKDTYLQVVLSCESRRKTFAVHLLVARHFQPNPLRLPEVNHRDLNKANNRASNLEWTTHKRNQEHAAAAGRFRALINPNCGKKLSLDDVEFIRQNPHIGARTLAALLGVSVSHIYLIIRRKTWV